MVQDKDYENYDAYLIDGWPDSTEIWNIEGVPP